MNNKFPPINLRAERRKFCENINTVVLGIKCVAFWKGVESIKSQEIPCSLGWYASVFQGVALLREARSARSLEKDTTMTRQE
jgi:hypothetical protein